MFSLAELEAAHPLVLKTLALVRPLLRARVGAQAVVKHENHNPTGAFKVRDGFTCFDALRACAFVSAALGEKGRYARIGLVLSGGDIDFALFQRWIVQDNPK